MYKTIMLIVISVLIFSGCAVMNTSMMETAETTRPGYPKFGVEMASQKNGSFGMAPIFAIGAGFDLQ